MSDMNKYKIRNHFQSKTNEKEPVMQFLSSCSREKSWLWAVSDVRGVFIGSGRVAGEEFSSP